MKWTPDELAMMDSASNASITFIIAMLADERGVHVETAISLAGSLAGVSILRNVATYDKIDLTELIRTVPGTPVFIESVNSIGTEVANFMMAYCQSLGIDSKSGWSDDVPEDNQPLRLAVEMLYDYEKPFIELMDQQRVPPEFRPFVAALAAMKLIGKGAQILNPDIGKSIAISAAVAASKTVPLA